MLNIAIIDDGINENEVKVDHSWEVDCDLNIINVTSLNKIDHESHGTTCLKIINKYLNKEKSDKILINSIKVINFDTINGNIIRFVKALEFCLLLKIKIIHLSIGTSYYRDFEIVNKIINNLVKNGTIIIAALNNKKVITYPACLSCVLGVKTNADLKDSEYMYTDITDIDNIEIIASSIHILRNKDGFYRSQISNSYAAPLITSKVVNYLLSEPNLSLDEVKSKLKLESTNRILNIYSWTNTEISIPVILFDNITSQKLSSLLQELQLKFYTDYYNCGVVTQTDDLAKMISFMKYDVVLLFGDIDKSKILKDISIYIRYDQSIDCINIIKGDIYYELTVNKLVSDSLYEIIMNILV